MKVWREGQDGIDIGFINTFLVCGIVIIFMLLALDASIADKEVKEPTILTSKTELICVSDTNKIEGNISGRGRHVYGSLTAGNSYQYYYQNEDGGIIQGSVPVNSTTIYYLKSNEDKAYLETITKTRYFAYFFGLDVETRKEITYKLYVPEGSISGYELDAE